MEKCIEDYYNDNNWELGKQLYENGMVSNISTAPNNTNLVLVKDACNIYKTYVSMNPIVMTCTCKLGMRGHRCKHMAAAFIALENKKDIIADGQYQMKPYEECSWYSIVEKYAYNSQSQKLKEYVNMDYIGREDFIFDDILSLVSYLLNEQYIRFEMVKHCILKLKKLRNTLHSDTYLELDNRLLMIVDDAYTTMDIKDTVILKMMFEKYFYEKDTYPSLKQFIEVHGEHVKLSYIMQIIYLNQKFDFPKDELMQLILPYSHY